jgi:hypothetical protein
MKRQKWMLEKEKRQTESQELQAKAETGASAGVRAGIAAER